MEKWKLPHPSLLLDADQSRPEFSAKARVAPTMTEPKSAADRIAFLEAELTSLRAITPSDRRIAEAPRAWVIKCDIRPVNGDDVFADETSARYHAAGYTNTIVVPVAIVELEGE